MDGRRAALIVASDEFEHAGLSRLQAPSADAEALAGVLGDPEIGGFQVEVVHNAPSHAVQAHVEDLFAEGRPDDLLLLHFSGHGLKSDSGELFFASTNTRPDRLASTAVSADFVQRCMRGSRARSIVLFLDCCYGGAFGEGVAVRAAGPANVLDSFPAGKLGGGRGRAVITASSAMEYAFEGSALATDDQKQPSVFTSAVVEGLRSGAADRDEDGLVSLNELYEYVFDQVRAQNPNQTPSRDIELQGELYVARSRRRRVRAATLPPDLRAAVQDQNMYTRLGAVGELRARLGSADPGVALGARETLQDIARADTSYVADAARDALALGSVGAAPAAPSIEVTSAPATGALLLPTQTGTSDTAPATAPAETTPADTAPAETTSADTAPAHAQPARPGGPTGPTGPADATDPRHRVPAGWTALTGGGLVLVSVALPQFVYSDGVFAFDRQLAVALLCVGALGAGVGTAALFLSAVRTRWVWPVTGVAVAAAIALVAVLDASSDLGASDVDVGIWAALAGCLTTAAAGVVSLAGLRSPRQSRAPDEAEPQPVLTTMTRTLGIGALVASGSMLVATFAVRFVRDVQALVEPDLVWAWLVPGFVGLAAGVLTLRPQRWLAPVGPALLVGAGAAALWGLWEMPRIWASEGTAGLDTGYFLELAGLVGLVALSVLALVVLRREHDLTAGPPQWRILALTLPVGLLAAVPFLLVAQWNGRQSQSGNVAHDVAMALLTVLVPVLTAMVRPEVSGRLMLLGWAVAATGIVIAYWRLLRSAGAELFGTPYVLLALAALVLIALTGRRAGPAPD